MSREGQSSNAYQCLEPRALFNVLFASTDVNFIASPPSMVAAGSVVAAVQGLYLKSQDASLSSQNLTNFLSQVIRSDPVWRTLTEGLTPKLNEGLLLCSGTVFF